MRLPVHTRVAALVRARPRVFLTAIAVVCIVVWAAVGASAAFLYSAVTGLPDSQGVRTVGTMARATTIVDVKGRHAFTLFQEQRLPVPLSRISPHLVAAILAVEDQRFYKHGGVDVIRVAGAGVNNLRAGRIEQGGSTITQQLARLAFLNPDRAYRRKVQEMVLATRLEQTFSKDEILEMYLNKAYFGDGLYGAEAAALGYFGRHASELTVAQAALIAGLVKAPSNYAPTVNPERAMARRNLVLRLMRDSGAIDRRAYDAAVAERLALNDSLRREEAYGRYFKEEVRRQLVEQFGFDRVYQDGLRVETTLDLDMQKAAEAEVARAIEQIEKRQARSRRAQADPLQAALVALDPRTGEVRAMVGGRNFDQSHFNRVTQARRQPGSAFKPFVYAAALERGFTPATILRGLSQPVMTARGAWVPEDDHLESDSITMRAALRQSSNRAAVRMIEEVGVPVAADYAERFGMGGMPEVPSLALGAGEVSMLSLVSAFGVFANDGVLASPLLIRRVTTSSGQVLHQSTPQDREVVSPSTAFLITSMLEDVVDAGTAAQARSLGFRLPAAGKTGTTNDYRDAWFIGYTPNLVAGVWVGYDKPRTIVANGYAAQLAVPMWTRFMIAATRGSAPQPFRAPNGVTGVTMCPLSGKLATDACRQDPNVRLRTEYFAIGTEPTEWCPHYSHIVAGPVAIVASGGSPAITSDGQRPVIVSSPDAPAPQPTETAEAKAKAEEPKKKRGFWGRVFGLGR